MSESDHVLDHVMIRVGDLDEAMDWYTEHFDYVEYSRWEADTFTNVKLGPEGKGEDEALLELTYNHGRSEYEMGDAWGHIAVRVEDVEEAYAELMDEGVEDYRPPEENPGYAFVKDPDGHEVEIVERDHGSRWSIDHTMVRVEDADAAIGYWARTFEYVPAGRWESDSFANYFMAPRGDHGDAMTVELTYNYDGRSYEMGDAWGHLAARLGDDLEEGWETLMVRESADYRDPESCDWNYAFTKTNDGHEIEVVTVDVEDRVGE